MYSSNVFAVLTPCDEKNKARSAFELPQNKKWFHKATGGVAEEPIINSREPTPAPDASSEDQDVGATDRLIVTFDDLLKELESCQSGLQFGTHLGLSHVLLGHRGTPGVSAKQYNITVGDNLWICYTTIIQCTEPQLHIMVRIKQKCGRRTPGFWHTDQGVASNCGTSRSTQGA